MLGDDVGCTDCPGPGRPSAGSPCFAYRTVSTVSKYIIRPNADHFLIIIPLTAQSVLVKNNSAMGFSSSNEENPIQRQAKDYLHNGLTGLSTANKYSTVPYRLGCSVLTYWDTMLRRNSRPNPELPPRGDPRMKEDPLEPDGELILHPSSFAAATLAT